MSPRTLDVAPGLLLPAEYALQRAAIFAISGAGKSNTAVALFEELHDAGVPAVAVDPKGDWWGIRSSSDGEGPGLPVPIFGGEHGDLPLEPTAGRMMARLIVEKRLSCVIDVSGDEFPTRSSMFRFLAEFAGTLLRQNRRPLHVFAEECDEYLPQGGMKAEGGDLARCLGAWQRLVKRGRQHGVGVTMISQRAAAVNIDARNQAETLIAMRQQAPRDVNAVKEWLVGPSPAKPTEDEAALLASLKDLDSGEAWVLSPQWLKIRERVQFRPRRTFDSGATPELGDEVVEPATLADVDLAALGQEIADAKERAEADDPEKLRARIADLEGAHAQAALRLHEKDQAIELLEKRPVEPVEVPVVPEEAVKELDGYRTGLVDWANEYRRHLDEALAALTERVVEAARLPAVWTPDLPEAPELDVSAARNSARPAPPDRPTATAPAPDPARNSAREAPPAGTVPPNLGASALRLWAAVATFGPCTRARAAMHARLKPNSGNFTRRLSELRVSGVVADYDGGRLVASHAPPGVQIPLTRKDVIVAWTTGKGAIGTGAQRMVGELLKAAPDGLTRSVLGERVGLVSDSGNFTRRLSEAHTAGLIRKDGTLLRASDDLLALP